MKEPKFQEINGTESTDLLGSKSEESVPEDILIKCIHIPFKLSSLDNSSTLPRLNTISRLSVTEMENNCSMDKLSKDDEEF